MAALTELARAAARVRVSGCLGHCDSSNNIVIIPSRQGRAADGSVTWIGYALSSEVTAAVADWVRAGGPGVAAMPSVLSAHVVDRRARAVR
ncbi:(2Fe-2S) ferredoxin domain-containing protein [Hamadaea sp. NPDC050747]|uniref:(2Fe-2S) ferredoxin domain-containing protein n=1 Tax=Hamadaea sp. NPDC050747 TaxID=3155789 RepID=UPI0033C4727D